MINLKEFEGHTLEPWRWEERSLDPLDGGATWNVLIGADGTFILIDDSHLMVEIDQDLIEIAPKLLVEIAQLRSEKKDAIQKLVDTGNELYRVKELLNKLEA